MNIGIFTDTYFTPINGVITSIKILADQLRKRGHKVFIFTAANPYYKEPSPNIFRLPSMPFIFFPAYRVVLFYPPKLILNIKKFDLDIIHTQTEFSVGMFGKLVSEFLKIPMIHTYHTMYEDYTHYIARGYLIKPKFAKKFSKIFCNYAQIVIAPTGKTKNSLISYGVSKPIKIIPTGINLEKFSASISHEKIIYIKKKLNINKNDFVLLFVGRIAKEKSIDVIINQMPKILEKIADIKLLIVGSGLYLENLKKIVNELKISRAVIFTGEISWQEINLYYKLANAFITASTSETQGLTYIEAIASGIPVIAKEDACINKIIINKKTGYVFKSEEEILKIILEIKNNVLLNNDIIKAAKDAIKDLSDEKFGLNLEKIYLEEIKLKKSYNNQVHKNINLKKNFVVARKRIIEMKDKFIKNK
jgi:1,2-diacylglycerol 3-alpha-glucosyltransferase